MPFSRTLVVATLFMSQALGFAADALKPDIIVAADGSGNFKTVQAAVASIPSTNLERTVIFIKDGVYKEKLRIDASFVTLRGQSRQGTRIEFPLLKDDYTNKSDGLGFAVINLNHADDLVLENLTAKNTAGVVGHHALTIQGGSDRTVFVDCDVLSDGGDTVALGKAEGGRHYHARCRFSGSVDFLCPRGWCYIADSSFYEMKQTAAMWHDGTQDPSMKFVLNNCKFDGVEGWNLARHHVDAQFFFINCGFSRTMADRAPYRVTYPGHADKNAELDKVNRWGERAYFYRCHRDGGDYGWHRDNLSLATNAPEPSKVTAAWTFAGTWDPEDRSGPVIVRTATGPGRMSVVFNEPVTVKGKARLVFEHGVLAPCAGGSGTDTLVFQLPSGAAERLKAVEVEGGAIVASRAAAILRVASLQLPKDPQRN
jgi:pectinesterase